MKQEARWTVLSPVDSTFERSENVAPAHFLVVSLSSCCWLAVRGVTYAILGSKFVRYYLHMRTVLTEIILFGRTVNSSCILITVSHIIVTSNILVLT